MLKKLIGLCLRGGDPKDPGIRRRCGAISGGMGIGLDRLTTTRHKISDIRLLFENDVRFLEQFA